MFELDHIAVAARNLNEGVAHVREALGVEMPYGGAHPLMGTHNHLMRLDNDAFVEVISVNPAVNSERPRWFDLDKFDDSPRLMTWVIRGDGSLTGVDIGPPIAVSRGDLHWNLTVRDDGSMPFDGACPAVISWARNDRPGARMADLGCKLERLVISHPRARDLSLILKDFSDPRVEFTEAEKVTLEAEIMTPSGLRFLR